MTCLFCNSKLVWFKDMSKRDAVASTADEPMSHIFKTPRGTL